MLIFINASLGSLLVAIFLPMNNNNNNDNGYFYVLFP